MASSPAAVSVLVPVHNAGPLLLQAVQSVLAQTHADFELVLIDDGSTDGCIEAVAALGDPRILLLRQPRQGAPAALNRGLREARGELIAFLDHDDLWAPSKLASHLSCFSTYAGTDLTFDWSRMIDEQGTDLGLSSRPWRGTISFEQMLEDFVIGNTSAIVARRQAIEEAGPLDCSLGGLYDLDLCLRVSALRPDNCRAVPEPLTWYRRHERQMSRDWRQLQADWDRFLRKVPGYAPRPVSAIQPVADANMHRYFAWVACEAGEYGSALRLILSALWSAPGRMFGDMRNWMVLAAALGGLVLPRSWYGRATALVKRLLAGPLVHAPSRSGRHSPR